MNNLTKEDWVVIHNVLKAEEIISRGVAAKYGDEDGYETKADCFQAILNKIGLNGENMTKESAQGAVKPLLLLAQNLSDLPYSLTPDQWATEAREVIKLSQETEKEPVKVVVSMYGGLVQGVRHDNPGVKLDVITTEDKRYTELSDEDILVTDNEFVLSWIDSELDTEAVRSIHAKNAEQRKEENKS